MRTRLALLSFNSPIYQPRPPFADYHSPIPLHSSRLSRRRQDLKWQVERQSDGLVVARKPRAGCAFAPLVNRLLPVRAFSDSRP